MIEIKSAQTISPEAMRPIANIRRALGERISGATLAYGGNERQNRSEFSDIWCDMIPAMIGLRTTGGQLPQGLHAPLTGCD